MAKAAHRCDLLDLSIRLVPVAGFIREMAARLGADTRRGRAEVVLEGAVRSAAGSRSSPRRWRAGVRRTRAARLVPCIHPLLMLELLFRRLVLGR